MFLCIAQLYILSMFLLSFLSCFFLLWFLMLKLPRTTHLIPSKTRKRLKVVTKTQHILYISSLFFAGFFEWNVHVAVKFLVKYLLLFGRFFSVLMIKVHFYVLAIEMCTRAVRCFDGCFDQFLFCANLRNTMVKEGVSKCWTLHRKLSVLDAAIKDISQLDLSNDLMLMLVK